MAITHTAKLTTLIIFIKCLAYLSSENLLLAFFACHIEYSLPRGIISSPIANSIIANETISINQLN